MNCDKTCMNKESTLEHCSGITSVGIDYALLYILQEYVLNRQRERERERERERGGGRVTVSCAGRMALRTAQSWTCP